MTTATTSSSVLDAALGDLANSPEFKTALEQIRGGARVISISGLVAAPGRALVLAALQRETGKQFALVVPAQRDLENWQRDIEFWYCALRGVTQCEDSVAILPASESDPYAGGSPHAAIAQRRVREHCRNISRGGRAFAEDRSARGRKQDDFQKGQERQERKTVTRPSAKS